MTPETQGIISTWTPGYRCSLGHPQVHPGIQDLPSPTGALHLNTSSLTMVLMSTTDLMAPQDNSDKTQVPQASLGRTQVHLVSLGKTQVLLVSSDHPALSPSRPVLLVQCPQVLLDSQMVMLGHPTMDPLLHLETFPCHPPLIQNLLPQSPPLPSPPPPTVPSPHLQTAKPSLLVYPMSSSEQPFRWLCQQETPDWTWRTLSR